MHEDMKRYRPIKPHHVHIIPHHVHIGSLLAYFSLNYILNGVDAVNPLLIYSTVVHCQRHGLILINRG